MSRRNSLALLLILSLLGSPLLAQEKGSKTLIKLPSEATVNDWLTLLSRVTGGMCQADPSLGKIIIRLQGPREVESSQVLDSLRTLLAHHYLTLSGTGKPSSVYQVYRTSQARWGTRRRIERAEEIPASYEIVEFLLPLKHLHPKEVQGAIKLSRIMHPNVGSIVRVKSSRSLMIADYGHNVRHLVELIRRLDEAARPQVFPIQVQAVLLRSAPEESKNLPTHGKQAAELLRKITTSDLVQFRSETSFFITHQPQMSARPQQKVVNPSKKSHLVFSSMGKNAGLKGTYRLHNGQMEIELGLLRQNGGRSSGATIQNSLPLSRPGLYAFGALIEGTKEYALFFIQIRESK